jgi:hypothetical protein
MIVIRRNGETTVYKLWRTWLIAGLGIVAVWILFTVLLFLWIGAVITLGLVLILIVPAAAVAAFLGSMMRR